MRIMVFDVPAKNGGAMTILNQYYSSALKDKKNFWIFVLSTPQLKESSNVKIINFPWIKKSWFHRLFFDKFVAHKLVKKHKIEEVISLQNIIIDKINVKQTLYLHQSLPFSEKKYKLFENYKLWIYQNLISEMIFRSIIKADYVIVQTKWVMNAAIKKTGVNQSKFKVIRPELNINVKKTYEPNLGHEMFFYPANGASYKNHKVIVEAARLLKNKNIHNYTVSFTLKGDENKLIRDLRAISEKEKLPIKFIGFLEPDEVYEYYSRSILVFPSYIETLGLPLLEAKIHKSPIIASDRMFSHELLDDYNKAKFFDPFDSLKLSEAMEEYIRT